jgi:hypothetical protein
MRLSALTVAAIALLAAQAGPVPAGAARTKPVYKVDSASAHVAGRKLVISAKGAVRTGGWENPRLRARAQRVAETDTLVVDFVASPPRRNAAVIQAILPVSATVTVRLPRYATVQVKIVAETNSITVPIETRR